MFASLGVGLILWLGGHGLGDLLLAAFGTGLGANLVNNFPRMPIATLLGLTIIRRRGDLLPTIRSMCVGIVTAPPTLLVATLVLWRVLR